MYAQYGIESLGLKKRLKKKHKKKLLPKTEIWCLVKRCEAANCVRSLSRSWNFEEDQVTERLTVVPDNNL